MQDIDFNDYGREDPEFDLEKNKPEKSVPQPRGFLGVAPELSEESENIGNRLDRGNKGFSIAGSVSA